MSQLEAVSTVAGRLFYGFLGRPTVTVSLLIAVA
jgi:hypothetical protein